MRKAFCMVKLLTAILSALACCANTLTTYSDQSIFLGAAQSIDGTSVELETFDPGSLHAPDLSVQTISGMGPYAPFQGYGYIANGVWNDCVGKICNSPDPGGPQYYYDFTIWNFARPTYAFGAAWTMGSAEPWDPGIVLMPGTSGLISVPLSDGFFGFVSETPFTYVTVNVGDGVLGGNQAQSYTMDNLEISTTAPADPAVPEPSGLLPLGALVVVFVCVRRKSQRTVRSTHGLRYARS